MIKPATNSTKAKLAVMISGSGSNFESIVRSCQQGEVDAEVNVAVTNNPTCFGIQRAKKLGIPIIVVDHRKKTRALFEQELLEALKPYQPDWIVLAGFMRVLSGTFLSSYPHRVINIHPSLLPQYPGMHAIEKAVENKEKVIGVTVHYVIDQVDAGPIIMQDVVQIDPQEPLSVITERVHALEHQIYKKAIQKLIQER